MCQQFQGIIMITSHTESPVDITVIKPPTLCKSHYGFAEQLLQTLLFCVEAALPVSCSSIFLSVMQFMLHLYNQFKEKKK